MRRIYDDLDAAFKRTGLDLESVRSSAKLFGGVADAADYDQGSPASDPKQQQQQQQPKQQQPYTLNYHTDWAKPLPEGSVRLVVFPIAETEFAQVARKVGIVQDADSVMVMSAWFQCTALL